MGVVVPGPIKVGNFEKKTCADILFLETSALTGEGVPGT